MKSGGSVLRATTLLAAVLLTSPVLAGDLNPPGAPGPTMKTLDQIPPTWDQIIPNAAVRFKLVMGGEAVLDKETGLVWERSPGGNATQVWGSAQSACLNSYTGSRMGWRLPTVEELATLVDRTSSETPAIPSSSPFTNVPSDFWSGTGYADDTAYAWAVGFAHTTSYSCSFFGTCWYYPGPYGVAKSAAKNIWCVRGGHGQDGR